MQGFIIKGVKIEYRNSRFIRYLINANFANHFSNKTALIKTRNRFLFPVPRMCQNYRVRLIDWKWMMAGLWGYFQRQSLPSSKETGLEEVITNEANAALERILEEERNGVKGWKRKYTHFTPEQRTKIAKYAVDCGNTAIVRHFSKEFPTLGESTVRLF